MDIINELADVLIDRKGADPDTSYVASLYAKGRAGILEKIEEESWELVEAATAGESHNVISETRRFMVSYPGSVVPPECPPCRSFL